MYDIILYIAICLSFSGVVTACWIVAKIWVASQIFKHSELSNEKVKHITNMFSKDIHWKNK